MLAPWIIEHMPPHRCYVEPFGGGGSVLLRKQRVHSEVYNDIEDTIVNLFRCARDHGPELGRLVSLTPFSRVEYENASEPCEDPLEQARRSVIRALQGFGSDSLSGPSKSGFRASSNGSGRTPARDWMNYPAALQRVVERLRGVVIENRPAETVMASHDTPETLHYCDPPYVHSTRSGRHGYKHEMTDEEHEGLAAFLKSLKGYVMLSGYPCDLYDWLYAGWRRVERQALADGAKPRTEVLWLSPTIPIADDLLTRMA